MNLTFFKRSPVLKDHFFPKVTSSKTCLTVWAFNAILNNISAISQQSVLLIEETGMTVEYYSTFTSH